MVSGAASVAQGLADQLALRGWQVLVLTASDCDYPYTIHKPNLKLKRLTSHHNPFRVGQRFMLWPYHETMRSLREFSPDIIHTHDPLPTSFSALAYARQANVPIILTVHQLPWFARAYMPRWRNMDVTIETLLWTYSRLLLPHFSLIITPTQTIADMVRYKTGSRCQAIGFGIDPAVFHPGPLDPAEENSLRFRLGIPLMVPVILHVGRLDIDKQVDLVVRAAAQAMRMTEGHLLVVGDGTLKNRLVAMCDSLGIGERSHFTGYINLDQGLPEIYRLATLFITASEIETQGIVLLEAAASGLPIVAVNATCIPEIVHSGVNGLLAAPGDVDDLAECIQQVLANPDRAREMGCASLQIAQGNVLCRSVEIHQAVYAGLLDDRTSLQNNRRGPKTKA